MERMDSQRKKTQLNLAIWITSLRYSYENRANSTNDVSGISLFFCFCFHILMPRQYFITVILFKSLAKEKICTTVVYQWKTKQIKSKKFRFGYRNILILIWILFNFLIWFPVQKHDILAYQWPSWSIPKLKDQCKIHEQWGEIALLFFFVYHFILWCFRGGNLFVWIIHLFSLLFFRAIKPIPDKR